jgi:serine/threonine protein phosphatase PrpC
LLSAEEAHADPRAHAITRWIGGDAPDGPPNVATLSATAPGRLVVCTDGLWNYLTAAEELDELVAALPASAAPVAIARALADTAMARGGRDDITVAVVEVQPPSDTRGDQP